MSDYKVWVYKEVKEDKKSPYRVAFTYIGPDGKEHRSCKRGFKLKKEANDWVENKLPAIISEKEASRTPDEMMTMSKLVEEYLQDLLKKKKINENTHENKKNIFESKILPYLGDKVVHQIDENDIRIWQNQIIDNAETDYAPSYWYAMETQLSSVLNYAMKYHKLGKNVMKNVDRIGKKTCKEKIIWTIEEYRRFIKELEYDPVYYYAFQVLFWCGLRRGELLALTPSDIDFENNTIRIDESYQRIKKKDVITKPKNDSSVRTFNIPEDLTQELKEYIDGFYAIDENTRIFPIKYSTLYKKLKKAIEAANVKKVTLHGFRHSNISMLANMGYNSVDIAYRAGHSRIYMTNYYTHRYEGTDRKIADALNEKMTGGD